MYEAEFELEAELEDLMTVLAKSDLVSEAESFAPLDLLREQAIIADLIARGVRNENQIADAVFFNRHPERNGRRLDPGESALVQEWVQIRDQHVRPMLGNGAVSRPSAPRGSGAHSTAAGNVGDNDVTVALRIANNKPVPNMPGVTIQQLIERYRPQISPEIPLPVLVAFLRYESGGNFEDATHGVLVGLDEKGKRVPLKKAVRVIRSPEFYELGLFQTPAGLHGCTPTEPTVCQYGPPGLEIPGNPSEWVKLCTRIGANPGAWKHPTTQVQVGLLNIETSAEAIRSRNQDLFSIRGNDWDLRAAVLLSFAGGGGYTQYVLNRYRVPLASLPEDDRWDFLRDKINSTYAKNVDEKMLLAAKLGYRP
jgi:hypothetical protein